MFRITRALNHLRLLATLCCVFSCLLVNNVFGLEYEFTDIGNDHWAKQYINKAVDCGVMSGEGKFHGKKLVNRYQASVILTKTLDRMTSSPKENSDNREALINRCKKIRQKMINLREQLSSTKARVTHLQNRLNSLHSKFKINSIGMELVWIPFKTTCKKADKSQKATIPENGETGFWLGKYEVTVGQWFEVMRTLPVERMPEDYNKPVTFVSWNMCQKFINKLNALEQTSKYRLPTIKEWEFAGRAGCKTEFHFGKSLSLRQANYGSSVDNPSDMKLEEQCTDGFIPKDMPVDVGSYPPNMFGLHDIHGNVEEWTRDVFDAYFGDTPPDYAERAFLGGSWHSSVDECKFGFYNSQGPDLDNEYVGFRVLMEK